MRAAGAPVGPDRYAVDAAGGDIRCALTVATSCTCRVGGVEGGAPGASSLDAAQASMPP